ncbi:Tfp pilus assembly protein FimT-like protein [Pseudomonas sp. ATCC 13867]|uniref:GspH/FimT family pseudopilin n=1 Tax=Pseudomonas sp. ATCC 13867 TaxID=1294143 RepID=UPI0002C4ECF1|nr:GspH/FimT family pseudopilin [Pseudomonas sp. ATCC 13867]AGI22825.1 Tfp pilus assembly protein FimT-like protein [Pseudomonas sp. ATCC 13867]RFQ36111.1 prepilin-type N-terminal cleavage/methylation domain-containing protein [Pseudomonas sp. ATCC 13867]
MSRPKESAGFTLIELMIVVTLLAIFATLAVPSFTATIERNRLQTQADELKSFLLYARGEAVSQKATLIVAADGDDLWNVKRGDADDALRQLKHDPELAQIRASADEIKFRSNGTATATAFTVCHNDDTATGLYLEVQASGAVKLFRQGTKDADDTALDSCTL